MENSQNPCPHCGKTYLLDDGRISDKWFFNQTICADCKRLEKEEIERDDEIREIGDSLSDARIMITEAHARYVRLGIPFDSTTEDIIALEAERWEWSKATFPTATAVGSLMHLKREVEEIQASFDNSTPDITELVDAQFMLWDVVERMNITMPQFFAECRRKFEQNKLRVWQNHPDGGFSHVAEDEL